MAETARSVPDRTCSVIHRASERRETWLCRAPRILIGVLAITLFATIVVGCSSASPSANPPAAGASNASSTLQTRRVSVDGGGSYTNVSATSLASMLKAKDFPLINVHIPYEGEIEGTDLFIPYTDVQSNLSKLPADKSARIVLYCRSGNMSDIAARALIKLGYTNVWNLDGGMIGWKQAGYQVAEKTH